MMICCALLVVLSKNMKDQILSILLFVYYFSHVIFINTLDLDRDQITFKIPKGSHAFFTGVINFYLV